MSRTIKAIERHMIPKATFPPARIGFPSGDSKLVAEWQQRGPETLSGYTSRKLRLAFSPAEALIIASAAG